jgi:hypothetical protein
MTYTTNYEKRGGKIYRAPENTGVKNAGNSKPGAPENSGASNTAEQNPSEKTGE